MHISTNTFLPILTMATFAGVVSEINYAIALWFSASDIKIFLAKSAEAITSDSKKLMTTMGEWELLDITTRKETLGLNNGQKVDELIFHVGCLKCSFNDERF